MKLEALFFVALFCLFSTFSLAAEQRIEVIVDRWSQPDRRSLSFVPKLTYDGNILFICSDVPLENLQIEVKDESGNVVYIVK